MTFFVVSDFFHRVVIARALLGKRPGERRPRTSVADQLQCRDKSLSVQYRGSSHGTLLAPPNIFFKNEKSCVFDPQFVIFFYTQTSETKDPSLIFEDIFKAHVSQPHCLVPPLISAPPFVKIPSNFTQGRTPSPQCALLTYRAQGP